MKSAELNELFTALAKAQSEMGFAEKDSNNPFYKSKYADLAETVSSTRPALTKNGLSILQAMHTNEANGKNYLTTIVAHSSGQFIEAAMELPSLNEFIELAKQAKENSKEGKVSINGPMQSLGSAITYMRRYAYAAMVGVISDEDDDGEAASRPYRYPNKRIEYNEIDDYSQAPARTMSFEKISKDQLAMLDRALTGKEHLVDSILKHYNYRSLADIPRDKFEAIYDRVVKIEAK